MKGRDDATELIVDQTFEEGPGELSSKNPMVLSCGGIYIPQRKRSHLEHKILWQIINLPDMEHPTKIVSSGLPKSPLAEIIQKESLN